ncbi:hypothetical protein D0Z07_6408 [Hyphodiscus hymeniophilus]|uniref:Uncharacterized protein n=1 Tax=Hyphodiscus hymeniophilus TaxID=353542 RepID=A0A9P6VF63_9HELO|nr:hypothetical protein D0Z07_6408 [Hyphodiscus hymeniophilus]
MHPQSFTLRRNKGHEVMVYLSHIIHNYDDLADVNIFMHSHRHSWHNVELLDHDAVQIIWRLSAERVQREGYMNMRCTPSLLIPFLRKSMEIHLAICIHGSPCGEEEYAAYWEKNADRVRLEEELKRWKEDVARIQQLREEGKTDEAAQTEEPEAGKDLELEGTIGGVLAWCQEQRKKAKTRGDVAMYRAVEAVRMWRDGHGF